MLKGNLLHSKCTNEKMGRVGKKRSDRRWRDPDGNVWASKFEWKTYAHLVSIGVNVRRCESDDAVSYCEPKPRVECLACGSSECVQRRIYTPDLYIVPASASSESEGYYLETKGYFRGEKRALFRHLRKDRPDIDLRVVFEADHWVTKGKTRLSDYFERYLKDTPYCIGYKNIPEEWL